MTTWPEVHAHLAATYGAAIERDGICEVRVPSPTAPPHTLPVAVTQVVVLSSSWLRLTCTIGSLRHLSPSDLLAHNLHGTIGVFCTVGGDLAIRQTLPLAGLRPEDLDEALRALAAIATLARN